MLDLKGYGPALMDGAIVTIELAFLSLALSVALGLIGASAKLSQSRVAKGIATTYTTLIRGVPDLVMMLLFYYGGQVAVNMLSDYIWETYEIDFFFQFDPFISGVVTIGLIFGAYMTETFRGAFLAVETGQIEAARAYGFTRFLTFRRIMLPGQQLAGSAEDHRPGFDHWPDRHGSCGGGSRQGGAHAVPLFHSGGICLSGPYGGV